MNKEITKLELTIGEEKVFWETPHTDCSVEELLQAFVGLMFTHTFSKECIINKMKDYIEDHED